jgi:hypothetical protein
MATPQMMMPASAPVGMDDQLYPLVKQLTDPESVRFVENDAFQCFGMFAQRVLFHFLCFHFLRTRQKSIR